MKFSYHLPIKSEIYAKLKFGILVLVPMTFSQLLLKYIFLTGTSKKPSKRQSVQRSKKRKKYFGAELKGISVSNDGEMKKDVSEDEDPDFIPGNMFNEAEYH